MPTLDEVYRKFGEVSEVAQLLETELGTMLLTHKCVDAGLLERPNSEKATAIHDHVTKQTLGKLIRSLGPIGGISENFEQRLSTALATRNRLTHTFYLQHNFRRNSDDGREEMLRDLEAMHDDLLDAYKAVLLLSGLDVDALVDQSGDMPLPTGHVRIRT